MKQTPLANYILLTLIALSLFACASVPRAVVVRTASSNESSWMPDHAHAVAEVCHASSPEHVDAFRHNNSTLALDPAGFRVLNWNVFKGALPGWLDTFNDYSDELDLIVIQEAYLTSELREVLQDMGMHWDLAQTFRRGSYATGVMTASRAAPHASCVQRTMEPLLALPKSTLISRFPLLGQDQTLLVANTHLVNFTPGTAAFRVQLRQLVDALLEHDGPLIIAGDFNTWSASRKTVLDELFAEVEALQPVGFDPQGLTQVFKRRLDYVYYRGLQVVDHSAKPTLVSDHNPMWITFRLEEEKLL